MNYTSEDVYKYISKKTWDPIVERKLCTVSWTNFAITQKDLEFYEKMSPVFDWKKYYIPVPKLCPEERQRRRLKFRNERKLYKRKCDITGDMIISIYSQNSDIKVSSKNYWWPWSKVLSKDFLSSKESCSDILNYLLYENYRVSMISDQWVWSTWCSYCQDISESENCYLCTWSTNLKNCIYTSNSEEWSFLI